MTDNGTGVPLITDILGCSTRTATPAATTRTPPGPSCSSATWRMLTKAPRITRLAPTSTRSRSPGRNQGCPSRPARTPIVLSADQLSSVVAARNLATLYKRDRVATCAYYAG